MTPGLTRSMLVAAGTAITLGGCASPVEWVGFNHGNQSATADTTTEPATTDQPVQTTAAIDQPAQQPDTVVYETTDVVEVDYNPYAADAAAEYAAGIATTYTPSPPTATGPAVSLFGEIPDTSLATAPDEADTMSGTINITRVSFAEEGADFDPVLTPDGKSIVFASTRHRPTADIYIKSVDGFVVTQLTTDPAHDVMPAVSPDGSRIAFASNRDGNWDVYVMPADGGQAIQITSTSANELHPSWSPDGSQIVYSRLSPTSGKWELWVADPMASGPTKFIGYGLFPQWCPVAGTGTGGSDRILFQRSRERGDRAFAIWTIDYKDGLTSNPTEIVSSVDGACINPSWSPDAKHIVYATVPDPDLWNGMTKPESAKLWMIAVNGTGLVELTTGSFVNLMPTWGPDDRIYYVSDRSGTDNVWRTGTARPLLAATGVMPGNTAITKTSPATQPVATVPTN